MASAHCSVMLPIFKLGDYLPAKKLLIIKETTWQKHQDIKNQVKMISY